MTKHVSIEVYEDRNHSVIFKGRLLGWVTPAEFERIMTLDGLQNKLYTVPTMPLMEAAKRDDNDGIEDLRLALAIHSVDEETVVGKKIFLSASAEYISSLVEDGSEVQIIGKNAYYLLSEEG